MIQICTELLYQPLTLLDCLHTFCGACLKEWFTWQAAAAENAPTPPTPDTSIFTCPSCRAPVRDTRHNATVATLLDMFLAANPEKSKSSEDKAEMNKKYKRGDKVLPKLDIPEKTPEQRRLDDQERMLLEEVRQMSLREAVANPSVPPSSSSRRRRESRSRERSAMRSRDTSREPNRGTRARDARERARRQAATDDESRRRAEQTTTPIDDGRQRRSESRQRLEEASRRHVEHQSSLRSLISSSDPGSLDVEREIEEFARQIQEEGLLDGLDLDNLDLSNNDDLSRKITEAYRRRQRQRLRNEVTRRSNNSRDPSHSDPATPDLQPRQTDSSRTSSRSGSRQRAHSRSQSNSRQPEDRSRPPLSTSAGRLDVQEPTTRHRRRTTSGGRSSTLPAPLGQSETRPAARSQTDLSLRPDSSDPSARPGISGEVRSSSTPMVGTSTQAASFNARMTGAGLGISQPLHNVAQQEQASEQNKRLRRPADLMLGPIGANFVPSGQDSPSLSSPSLPSPGHRRSGSQLYPEPSLTCQRCRKGHIEYELHYTCSICHGGNWNICLDCYRRGKGCLHWFGFGHAAWSKWEKVRRETDGSIAEPHILAAKRYLPPKVIPGGADGRQTLTTQNPAERLQSTTFCSRCLAWTNESYWTCGTCNEGEWGYCTDCVNQGRCCTHPLLPLSYDPPNRVSSPTSASSPRSPNSPHQTAGTAVASPGIRGNNSAYQPLEFMTQCDNCNFPIPPAQTRFHCFSCKPSASPETGHHGDYDICQSCYGRLVVDKAISPENGPCGWRRCPQGHRMAVVGFQEGSGGKWRSVVHDCVGGRKLQQQHSNDDNDDPSPSPGGGLQTWYWFEGDRKLERLVARDVRATAVTADAPGTDTEGRLGAATSDRFPPDGGGGMRAVAKWAWYPAPGADDELLFPRWAEIREIDDVNGEWFHGVYMGAKGIFPAPYVQIFE